MKYPRKVAIGFQEGTCPLSCPKCFAFNGKSGRNKEVKKMPLGKAQRLIDEIAGWPQKPVIQPHIFTEPFANRDLKEIIRYCHNNGVFVSIITNGILIDEDWMQFIICELGRNDTVSFSLDAVSQGTYEKVRGKYDLSELEQKVQSLLIQRSEGRGPRISVSFTIEEQNFEELNPFIDKWKYRADAVRATVGLDNNKRFPEMFRKQGIDNIYECGLLNEVMTIDTDGHVRACQYDAFGDSDFGSVFEKGIMGIWEGNGMEQYRLMQKQGRLDRHDYCFQCEMACSTKLICREEEDFIINEGAYTVYYNRRGI